MKRALFSRTKDTSVHHRIGNLAFTGGFENVTINLLRTNLTGRVNRNPQDNLAGEQPFRHPNEVMADKACGQKSQC
jgi:hypothetical protein